MSRPIDADRLKVVLEKNYGHTGGASVLAQLIDAQLTIQPERKKGKWIEWDEDCTWECSACGEPWTLIEGTPKQNGMNYCPNCGARMMEGEGDDPD